MAAQPTAAAGHGCNNDDASLAAFEDSLFTLFEQPVIAHSAPPGQACYMFSHPRLAKALEIALPAPPAGLNSLQAQYLWPSSLFLAHLLLTDKIALARDQTAVELGAGSGLGGLTAAVCFKQAGGGRIVSTDWGDAAILSTLEDNYRRNLSRSEGTTSVDWDIVGHKWGEDVGPILSALSGSSAGVARIDHLLLCDLLYYSAAHSALLASVLALLSQPKDSMGDLPQAHITAGLHGGTSSAVDRFVRLADDAGCLVAHHGIFTWNAREDVWREVDIEREPLAEGMVWWGTLRPPCAKEGAEPSEGNA